MCVCATYIHLHLQRLKHNKLQPVYTRAMSGPRLDVLKVFLGNLKRTVIKPEVCDMLEQNGLTPVDVIVPQGKGIAFAVFPDPEQTTRAVEIMHGVRHSCATAAVSAHRGANMGVFSNC